jgi:gluconate 2-dehydrogenase alpha chain
MPPLRTDVASDTFDKATKNMGLHPFISPRAILSEPYKERPGCTYCGFCQTFGCHVGAKSSTLVNKIPEAEETKNFTVITGAMVHRVNTDSAGKATGVSFYGPDGFDNQVEADLVILAPFVYDNVRLLMLSKTSVHQNGLSNSSGLLGKGLMTHIRPSVFVAFDDKKINIYMGPNAQRHSIDDYNADNFDHKDLGFIRGGQISIGTAGQQGGPMGAAINMVPPPGIPRYGAAYRDWYAKYFASHMSIGLQIEDLPYLNQTIDLDPDVRDAWGCQRHASHMIGVDPMN